MPNSDAVYAYVPFSKTRFLLYYTTYTTIIYHRTNMSHSIRIFRFRSTSVPCLALSHFLFLFNWSMYCLTAFSPSCFIPFLVSRFPPPPPPPAPSTQSKSCFQVSEPDRSRSSYSAMRLAGRVGPGRGASSRYAPSTLTYITLNRGHG